MKSLEQEVHKDFLDKSKHQLRQRIRETVNTDLYTKPLDVSKIPGEFLQVTKENIDKLADESMFYTEYEQESKPL